MNLPSYLFNSSAKKSTSAITFTWLLHLRWGAIACQFLLISISGIFFTIDIPIFVVVAILTFEIVSNLYFFYQKKQQKIISEWLFRAIMFFDVVLLTILLAHTGGAMNPFTFFYLLHVVIGAVLMEPLPAWLLGIFTIGCYTSFFLPADFIPFNIPGFTTILSNQPVCLDVASLANSTESDMKIHLQGMLAAFSITTLFLVFFIGKIRKSLDSYYETIEQLQSEKTKNEKLAALATLSAGAAHEFSTPLATIDVASGEMLYFCKKNPVADELVDDIHLIKNQVKVCKEILDQLSADSGAQKGETLSQFSIEDLVQSVFELYPDDTSLSSDISSSLTGIQFLAPLRTFVRILGGIIKNSKDTISPQGDPRIHLFLDNDQEFLKIEIVDHGSGMEPEIMRHATEPFFTTKAPGKGMGLGLFLARSVAERFAGSLAISSKRGEGTTVTVQFALSRIIKPE